MTSTGFAIVACRPACSCPTRARVDYGTPADREWYSRARRAGYAVRRVPIAQAGVVGRCTHGTAGLDRKRAGI